MSSYKQNLIENNKDDHFNSYLEEPNYLLKKSRMSKLCNSFSSLPSAQLKNSDVAKKIYSSLSSPSNKTTLMTNVKSNGDNSKLKEQQNSNKKIISLKYLKKKNADRAVSNNKNGSKIDLIPNNRDDSGDNILLLPQEEQVEAQEQQSLYSLSNTNKTHDSYYNNDNKNDYDTSIKKPKSKRKSKKKKALKQNRMRANTSTTSVTASFSSNSLSFNKNKTNVHNIDPSSSSVFYLQEMYNTLPPMAQQDHHLRERFAYQYNPLSSFIHPNFYDQQQCNTYNHQVYQNPYHPQPQIQPIYHMNHVPPLRTMNNNLGISRPPLHNNNPIFPSWNTNNDPTPKSLFFPKEFDTFSANSEEDGFYISFIEKNDTASTLSYDSMLNTPKQDKSSKKKKRLEIRIPSFGNNSNCGSKNNPIVKISSSPLLQQYHQEQNDEQEHEDGYDHQELETKLHELLFQLHHNNPHGNSNTTLNQQQGLEHAVTPIGNPNSINIDHYQTNKRQYFVFNHGSFASSYNSHNSANQVHEVVALEQQVEHDNVDIYTYCSSSSSSPSSVTSSPSSTSSSSYCEDFNAQQFALESSPTNNFDKPLDFFDATLDDGIKYSFEEDIIDNAKDCNNFNKPFDFFDEKCEDDSTNSNLFTKELGVRESNCMIGTAKDAKILANSSTHIIKDGNKDKSSVKANYETEDNNDNIVSTSSLTDHASSVFGVKLRPSSRSVNENDTN